MSPARGYHATSIPTAGPRDNSRCGPTAASTPTLSLPPAGKWMSASLSPSGGCGYLPEYFLPVLRQQAAHIPEHPGLVSPSTQGVHKTGDPGSGRSPAPVADKGQPHPGADAGPQGTRPQPDSPTRHHRVRPCLRSLEERINEFYGQVADLIERSLKLGITMDLVRPCNTRVTAYSMIGAVKEVVLQVTSEGQTRPPVFLLRLDDLVQDLIEFGIRGLLTSSQAHLVETVLRPTTPETVARSASRA